MPRPLLIRILLLVGLLGLAHSVLSSSPALPGIDPGPGLAAPAAAQEAPRGDGEEATDSEEGAGEGEVPPPPAEDAGILSFFAQAGLMAKVVLGILVLFSVGSWAVMIAKGRELRRARRDSEKFLHAFRESARFSEVSRVAGDLDASPLVGIFRAGYAEIDSQIKTAKMAGESAGSYRIRSLESLERSLQRAIRVETSVLRRWTPFLATTASATPFIGLFGTVWGIMVAFGDIGATGSTSIVTVAPGIAEALVNTAAGLAAAIPALIGYNHFAQRLREVHGRMDDFALEFLNLAERNFT